MGFDLPDTIPLSFEEFLVCIQMCWPYLIIAAIIIVVFVFWKHILLFIIKLAILADVASKFILIFYAHVIHDILTNNLQIEIAEYAPNVLVSICFLSCFLTWILIRFHKHIAAKI